jgi:uncharacterized membrane protein
MKVTRAVASENSLSTTIRNVAARKINGNVTMVIVSLRRAYVMVNPNATMALMKVKKNAASKVSDTTTKKSVAATLILNGPVPVVSASLSSTTVMASINVTINLMRSWRAAALESSRTTTPRSVAATLILNGPVLMVIVSPSKESVTVKLNAVTNQMITKKSAVSWATTSTTVKSVAATLKLNGLVPTANALIMIGSAMARMIV